MEFAYGNAYLTWHRDDATDPLEGQHKAVPLQK